MIKIALFTCFILTNGVSVMLGQSLDPRKDVRKIAEVSFSGIHHTYRSDDGTSFRLGVPPVEFGFLGGIGISNQGPYAIGDFNGVHENVYVSNPPPAVVSWAKAYPGALNQISLRLQDSYGGDAGFFLFPRLKVGAGIYKNSWRHDYLGYSAGTDIPYAKGIQQSYFGFAEYTAGQKWQTTVNAGAGRANIRYVQGDESFLSDGDASELYNSSGTIIPASLKFGRFIPFWEDEKAALLIFTKYDFSHTSVGTTTVNRGIFLFGIRLMSK
jgi:hypothetical protein